MNVSLLPAKNPQFNGANSQEVPFYAYLLNAIETVQLCFALFWAPLSAVVFLKRTMCHRNLVMIIMSTFLLYIILIVARLSICIMGFMNYGVLGK